MLDELIKKAVNKLQETEGIILVITHYDTDGITAGAIIANALKRADRSFKIKTVTQFGKKDVEKLKEEKHKIIFLLDIGSGYLKELSELESEIFIIDHHEINQKNECEKIHFMNPMAYEPETTSSSAIAYLFAKQMDTRNMDLAHFAVLGMVGDLVDQNISKIGDSILREAREVTVKTSLLLFPSTRPLNKALEFSSIYIPGVTGSSIGSTNLIREAGIRTVEEGKYKTILDLTSEEISRLITLITLKKTNAEKLIGKIYQIKLYGQLEDARELSALINACGRLGYADVALAFCLGSRKARTNAENIYSSYKHHLIAGLNWISMNAKIEGENYVIINAGDSIKPSLIGTLMTILSFSFIYPENTVLVGMSYDQDNTIKISARVVGEGENINLKKILEEPAKSVGGETGGHKKAAGGSIPIDKENEFLAALQREISMDKVQIAQTLNN